MSHMDQAVHGHHVPGDGDDDDCEDDDGHDGHDDDNVSYVDQAVHGHTFTLTKKLLKF